ncbi:MULTISPECIES: hypothetical protein [Pseudomonadati]|uniref:Uncharacterized protein n=1 Tax=Shewanella aestuarii TaxID=1028752 RepID=A0ABT0L1E6_9GAMM|nr:hypothetical protein [Shewanella aestuarii]MCL1117553.1 hypothetical protein [Shewanella aestuarii]GGN75384.1 hypothetical protein GCM10009193_15550 [Shewanella aestuarii]
MPKILVNTILLASLSNITVAAELPTILDFLPICEPTVLSEFNQEFSFSSDVDEDNPDKLGLEQFRELSINNVLLSAQENGKKSGAEAIIVEQLLVNSFARKLKTYSDSGKRLENEIRKFNITIKTKNISLCDNKQLSNKSTPFNRHGKKIISTNVSIAMALPDSEKLIRQAQNHTPPKSSVSVNGAYEIILGDSFLKLTEKMGPESIKLLTDDDTKILGYGRSLWFHVKNDKVISIEKSNNILNSHGTNLIEFSENYDIDDWYIGSVNYRDTYQKASKILDLVNSNNDIVVYGKQSQLLLNFESFKKDKSKEAELLLNGFTVLPLGGVKKSANLDFSATASIDISHAFFMDTQDVYQLNNQQRINQINLTEEGIWVIGNENLLFSVNDDGLVNKIRVTESIIRDQSKQEFNQVLSGYNIPMLKSEFLTLYPDAEDNFDTVMVFKGNKQLFATFDSYEDNAQLIDVVILFDN